MIEKIKNKHLLIDGDIVKYRCAAAAEKTKYLVVANNGNEDFLHYAESHKDAVKQSKEWEHIETVIWSRKEIQPVEFALQACKTTIETLEAKLSPSAVSIFLSPPRNFRDDAWRTQPYKGNRNPLKPKYLKDVEQYLIKTYGATVGANVEADDEIGRHLSSLGSAAVSVSIDKDLLQISGWHYNWVNDRIQWVSPKDADFNFYIQMLTGDDTDNIPGISGIGPKRAKEILTGARSRAELCTRVWMYYRGEFTTTDKARAYFIEQANLLWILRSNDFRGGFHVPDGVKLQ